jgi:hypothetical protein
MSFIFLIFFNFKISHKQLLVKKLTELINTEVNLEVTIEQLKSENKNWAIVNYRRLKSNNWNLRGQNYTIIKFEKKKLNLRL